MLKTWKTLTRETLLENPWWKYNKDLFEIEDGTQGEYHYVDSPGSVMVVPVLDDGRLLMVRQYRYLNGRESVEFPAAACCPAPMPRPWPVRNCAKRRASTPACLR